MRAKLIILVALVLAAGCDRQTSNTVVEASKEPKITSTLPIAASHAEQVTIDERQGEITLDKLTGVWRIVAVVPDPASSFTPNDKRVLGALFDVMPEQISWTYKPSIDFASDDVCFGPVSALVDSEVLAKSARHLLSKALAENRNKSIKPSQIHQWKCGDGGDWGNEALFQELGSGRMIMRWREDVTFVLERLKKLPTSDKQLEPTGAYEQR